MNLYQLYYFRTLAKIEHYTRAAEELCMTQPSLSHAIAALEDDLGVPLFRKKGRNVVLTKYGKLFLPYVENCINELEAGIKKIKDMSDHVNGTVSVGFIYTLSSYFIPNLLIRFGEMENNKNIKFILQEGQTDRECTAELIKGLKEEKYDLIFASLIPDDPAVEFIPIFQQRLMLFISQDHPLAAKETADLCDLEEVPFVHYSGKVGLRNEIDRLFAKVNIKPYVMYEMEDEFSMLNLVGTNIGVTIMPENPMYESLCRERGIKILPITNPHYDRIVYIGSVKNRFQPQPVQEFRDFTINGYKHGFPAYNQ